MPRLPTPRAQHGRPIRHGAHNEHHTAAGAVAGRDAALAEPASTVPARESGGLAGAEADAPTTANPTEPAATDARCVSGGGLMAALPAAARAARLGSPDGTEGLLNSLAARLGDVANVLPQAIASTDGDLKANLMRLAFLL